MRFRCLLRRGAPRAGAGAGGDHLGVDSFSILLNHRSFQKTSGFPGVFGGFLERRIPGLRMEMEATLGQGLPFGAGSEPFWDPILVGRCTTHFRTYFSGWIGMFTGGTGF